MNFLESQRELNSGQYDAEIVNNYHLARMVGNNRHERLKQVAEWTAKEHDLNFMAVYKHADRLLSLY